MHLSSYKKMEYMIRFYEKFFPDSNGIIKVLDIGSYDKGGSYRAIFENPKYSYLGLDITKGLNVDLVLKDAYYWSEIEDETFDIVISGQTFEYIEYPWMTMKEIERILRPSGFCFIIVPSSVYYEAPNDCGRYYPDGLRSLAKWADMKVHHTSIGGVPETDNITDWVSEWNDVCLVAQKEPVNDIKGEPFEKELRVPVNSIDAYNMLRERIKYVCSKFSERKPYVLFGAGWIGDMVLEILGSDNISFFIDNSTIKIGTERKGKKVISFQDYRKDIGLYNCLITASESASSSIKKSLEGEGIECQTLYEE